MSLWEWFSNHQTIFQIAVWAAILLGAICVIELLAELSRLAQVKLALIIVACLATGWGLAEGYQVTPLRKEMVALTQEANNLCANRLQMAEKWPVVIAEIELLNTASGGTILDVSRDHRFLAHRIRFITFKIKGQNPYFGCKRDNQSSRIEFEIAYVKPDGSIERNAKESPPFFTTSATTYLEPDADTWEAGTGWGNEKGGSFERGLWQIYFFHNKGVIAETSFLVE